MKPKWWMKYGIIIVLAVIIIIFLLGYLVRYPDVIISEIQMSSSKPSITLPIAQGSQIKEILVKNNSEVLPGQNLIVLRNNADYQDVILLDKELTNFSFNEVYQIKFFERFLTHDLQLGDLIQNDWMEFSNQLLAFYKIKKLNSFKNQIKFLELELEKQLALQKKYNKLVIVDNKQKDLISKKITADSILFKKQVLSPIEYNLNKQNYYTRLSELEQNNLALDRINLEITKLNNNIENTKSNEDSNLLTQQLSIRKALNKLQSSIEAYKKNYMLISPIKGKVSFIQNLEENRFTEGNSLVILPDDDNFYGIIKIPVAGAGKAKINQKVIVKLNDYPYKEFGVLTGYIADLYPISNEKSYLGKVIFKNTELSSYKKKLELKENMQGIAEVVTNDRNILERVFESVIYVFNNKNKEKSLRSDQAESEKPLLE